MLKLSPKLRRLKPVLWELNKEHYSHISLRVEQARDQLHQAQEDYILHILMILFCVIRKRLTFVSRRLVWLKKASRNRN